MSELKPCPFCGAENTDVGFIVHTDDCYLMRRYIGVSSRNELGIVWNIRPIEDALRADLARRDEIIARLKEDGETLSSISIGGMTKDAEEYWECPYCMAMAYNAGDIHHTPDCPITLAHRALMKELE